MIGVVADTHGILLPEALRLLAGSSLILHAGDVGPPAILRRLEELAPVRAVYGNTDAADLRAECPAELVVDESNIRIAVVHGDRWPPNGREEAMARHFVPQGAAVVIYGHTHVARISRVAGIMVFNPGSAGKRNFGHRLSVGRLHVSEGTVEAEILPIEP
jgi:uncharacterized protein